ncbi:MAG: tetratricopeptide repeat protein [Calditrichia bacterium]
MFLKNGTVIVLEFTKKPNDMKRLLATILFLTFAIAAHANAESANVDELQKAIALYTAGDTLTAVTLLEKFCTAYPDNSAGFYYLGRIAYDREKNEQAEKHFERAVDLAPDSSMYVLWLGRSYVKTALNSNIIKKTLYARKIKRCFMQAVELDSLNTLARHDLIQFYVLVPAIAGGSDSKAIEHATILEQQNSWEGFKAFGTIYSLQKDYEKAENIYLTALSIYPREIQFYNYLASVYEKAMAYEKLMSLYEEASNRLPELRSEILLKQAGICLALNEDAKAHDFLIAALEDNTEHAEAHQMLAALYRKNGDFQLAKYHEKKAGISAPVVD